MKNFKQKAAESLIETIIAVTIIGLSATGAMIAVRMALVGNQTAEDRLQALSFAQEGIETIRNIRDTNYLRFELDECWNSLEGTSITDCADALIDDSTYYVLKVDMEDVFGDDYLEESADADVFADEYRLYECEFNGGVYNMYLSPSWADPTAEDCVESNFFRQIYIEYDTGDPATASLMDVTATVNWTIAGEEKTVSLTESINR